MRTSSSDLLERSPLLSAGVLSADVLRLGEELAALETANADIVHIDVMDGVFCPQLTVGPWLVKALPDQFIKDVHLLVDEPLRHVEAYVDVGADIITFHAESTIHPHRVLQSLAGSGVVRGVALNPGTPVAVVEPLLDELDLVLLLAVNPGFPGQSFLPSTETRLEELRNLIQGGDIVVAVDGGITKENLEHVALLGFDVVVAGSALFAEPGAAINAPEVIRIVRQTAEGREVPRRGDF